MKRDREERRKQGTKYFMSDLVCLLGRLYSPWKWRDQGVVRHSDYWDELRWLYQPGEKSNLCPCEERKRNPCACHCWGIQGGFQQLEKKIGASVTTEERFSYLEKEVRWGQEEL